jgi:hypothetical protein
MVILHGKDIQLVLTPKISHFPYSFLSLGWRKYFLSLHFSPQAFSLLSLLLQFIKSFSFNIQDQELVPPSPFKRFVT